MSTNPSLSEEQNTLTMKKQLLGELWSEIRRAVEALKAARGENESLKQNLARASSDIEKLKAQISNLEKMLTARDSSSGGFEEREKNRLVEVARELISKIDTQLSLF